MLHAEAGSGRSGIAMEFRAPSVPTRVESIEVSLVRPSGEPDVQIEIWSSRTGLGGIREPDALVEQIVVPSFRISSGEPSIVLGLSPREPVLIADWWYYVAVRIADDVEDASIRWEVGDPTDTGFTRYDYSRALGWSRLASTQPVSP